MFASKFYSKSLSILAASTALGALMQAQAGEIGDSLEQALDGLSAASTLEVIVTFDGDGPPTDENVALLEGLGLNGVTLKALPMAGVIATPSQIEALNADPDVRSLWLNEPLEYDNAFETALTGVDRMRLDTNLRNNIGLPYSGKGIGVLVNDSGVDGQNPDLSANTVQNVAAQLNLNSYSGVLPVTWVEDVPDTDIGGGHGTHVAGIIAGTGASSGGEQEGAAPGADIIGYGSGAVLFILDTLGAFDYALTNQYRYNIRVVANSFGSTGDSGTDFDPEDPTNIATKKLTDRGVVVVISAGNSGSGEGTITGNFKKAPWVITVAAGDNDGKLADFSSRGRPGVGGTVTVDGETYDWVDEPTITAPGVDVISTRAKTDALSLAGVDPADPLNIYYTTNSGTSMSSPHISGVVALMLEANPMLSYREVKEILQDTATNIPGKESWEVGAGYVNAYAAVMAAVESRTDYGLTPIANREFVARADLERITGLTKTLTFLPVGDPQVETFQVASGISTVSASAQVGDNTVAIVLKDPAGNRYGSSISIPVLGENIAVTAPGMPGTWTVQVGGIGSVSGVALDPLGVTNGTALPLPVDVDINFTKINDFIGLNDVSGHPAQGIIEYAIAERLMDAHPGGYFKPDRFLSREDLADYLVMGGGIRQFRASNGSSAFPDDRSGLTEAVAEAASAKGAAIRDREQAQASVILQRGDGKFAPKHKVSRASLAYSLIQTLGMEAAAADMLAAMGDDDVTATLNGNRVPVTDTGDIPADLRGHVQLAIDLELMPVKFGVSQGPFDLTPTFSATFEPERYVTRAEYAQSAVNLLDRFNQ